MKLWAKTINSHKIVSEVVQEFALARPSDIIGWTPIIHQLCQSLDLSRPVILQKHAKDLIRFSRVVFKAGDFIESVTFDQFEIEIFSETKKENE